MSARTVVAPAGVPSPCTDVCTMDPATGWCLGCRRTIDEIASWGSLDDAARRRVVAALPARRFAGEPARSIATATGEAPEDPPR